MISLLRNPEVKRSFIIAFSISLIFTLVAFLISFSSGVAVAVVSVFWHLFYLLDKFKRYRKISELSSSLDLILNENQKMQLEDYTEGELSILASSIEKLLNKLHQQQFLL